MWMYASSGPHALVFTSDSEHLQRLLKMTSDRHHPHHARLASGGNVVGAILARRQMAVLIKPGHVQADSPSESAPRISSTSTFTNNGVGLAIGVPGATGTRCQLSMGPRVSSRRAELNGK